MASRRLNERLAKYNYLYDTDTHDGTNGNTVTISSPDAEDRLSNGDTFSNNNNNNMNSDRVTSSSISRKYSDSSSVSVAASIDSPKSPTTSFSKGLAPRGPLLSHITTTASARSNYSTNASPPISSRNVSSLFGYCASLFCIS